MTQSSSAKLRSPHDPMIRVFPTAPTELAWCYVLVLRVWAQQLDIALYIYWRFPEIGVPPVLIHFRLVFSIINYPFGVPLFMETPICMYTCVCVMYLYLFPFPVGRCHWPTNPVEWSELAHLRPLEHILQSTSTPRKALARKHSKTEQHLSSANKAT